MAINWRNNKKKEDTSNENKIQIEVQTQTQEEAANEKQPKQKKLREKKARFTIQELIKKQKKKKEKQQEQKQSVKQEKAKKSKTKIQQIKEITHLTKSSLSKNCLLIGVLVLVITQIMISVQFDNSTVFDMLTNAYRTDNRYMDVYCEAFHDVLHKTFYKNSCYFEDEDTLEIEENVQNCRKMKEVKLYAAANAEEDLSYVASYNEGDTQLVHSTDITNVNFKQYALGNAFSDDFVTHSQSKQGKNKNFVLYVDENQSPSGIYIDKEAEKQVTQNLRSHTSYAFSDDFVDESVKAYFKNNKPVALEKISIANGRNIDSNYYYTFSDKEEKYKLKLGIYQQTKSYYNSEYVIDYEYDDAFWDDEEELEDELYSDITRFNVWNLVYAPCKLETDIYPILYYSPNENLPSQLMGNTKYVERYQELYGDEIVYVRDDVARKSTSLYYNEGRQMEYSELGGSDMSVEAALTEKDVAVGLFIDERQLSQSSSSIILQLEKTVAIARGSIWFSFATMLFSLILALLGKFKTFLKYKQKCKQLIAGIPVEIHIVIVVISVYVMAVVIPMTNEETWWILGCRIAVVTAFFLYDFLVLKNIVQKGKKAYRNSIFRHIAQKKAEQKKEQYGIKSKEGFAFYLLFKTIQFILIETELAVALVIGMLTPYIIAQIPLSITFSMLRAISYYDRNMYWYGKGVIVLLVVFIIYFLIDYLLFIRKYIKEVAFVQTQLEQMSEGEFSALLEMPEEFAGFDMVKHLSGIQAAVHKSMENEMKSERMKVELVANVSHDIKTPLTSIINYVDLLSEMEDLPPVASDYIGVLQRKSYRLKAMIQDLFDLSKASSGNLPVEMKEIDFTKLVQQTLADMEELISASSLTFKVQLEEHIKIISDGNRLYRVIQNLVNNALLYSMEHSRVYITLEINETEITFKIQNTSKAELNYSKEQIMERFFRGDKSRTTEGSGLGVAIANSFTQVCGGTFDIDINADLFSAVMVFPLQKQE